MFQTPKKEKTPVATTPDSPTEPFSGYPTPLGSPVTSMGFQGKPPYSPSMEPGNTVIAIREPFDSARRIIYNKAKQPATTGYTELHKDEAYYDDPDPTMSIYIYDYTGERKGYGPGFPKENLFHARGGPSSKEGGKRRSKRRRSKRRRSKRRRSKSKRRRRSH